MRDCVHLHELQGNLSSAAKATEAVVEAAKKASGGLCQPPSCLHIRQHADAVMLRSSMCCVRHSENAALHALLDFWVTDVDGSL